MGGGGGGGDQDFKREMLIGGIFSEILVGGTKREENTISCGSPIGRTCEGLVMIDHHVVHIFYIFFASFQQRNILRLASYFYYAQYGEM